jgi:hypothetical protein
MAIQVIDKEINYPMHIEGICSRFKRHCQSKKLLELEQKKINQAYLASFGHSLQIL